MYVNPRKVYANQGWINLGSNGDAIAMMQTIEANGEL